MAQSDHTPTTDDDDSEEIGEIKRPSRMGNLIALTIGTVVLLIFLYVALQIWPPR